MCPNREYISSPGAQVSRLRRMESLQLAVVCPKGGSNKQKKELYIKKVVSSVDSFYFGSEYTKICWIRETERLFYLK